MIKVKMVTSPWGNLSLDDYARRKRAQDEYIKEYDAKEARKKLIEDKLKVLRTEYKEIYARKLEHDKKMERHVEEICRSKISLVEDYTRQISKMEQALAICKKALSHEKKEATKKWREDNPFPELKKIQNKISAWENQKYKL